MAIVKCKMCGGDLELVEGSSVCECEYCGTKQTVPTADNEKKLTLFARANRLRAVNEFDKAAGVYESIVADFPEEAEAYWGLVLCRYGIEYVDDPATGKKIPTCHRSSFDSVLKDNDFDQACENADAVARRQYREEAKQIEDIRRSIIEVSGKEEPYDIFICYKEIDENGERTIDSVLAQDVYDALTAKGYRVFFSRISLEDKLGTEYEPYIFAALNSAKIMLAFGTDYEYYNAVWVKNEWSRFLKLMAKDKSKHLIPCYKNLDPYDIPEEFQRLQAQDLGKVGAMQDLTRGIDKLFGKTAEAGQQSSEQQAAPQGNGPNATALLDRGGMALEDGEWENAKDFFDQVLNMDSRCVEAYLGLALAGAKLCSSKAIGAITERLTLNMLERNPNYERFLRFASPEQKSPVDAALEQARATVTALEEQARREAKERTEQKRKAEEERNVRVKIARRMIAAGSFHTVGLRSNGTVVATKIIEDVLAKNYGQSNLGEWRDIVAVAAGTYHTVGLRFDGTVTATGQNKKGQCSVSNWRDIIAVATGSFHTVGLRSNGTVMATGENKNGQCNVSDWRDIIAVAAGSSHTVGLRSNGTVTATGGNKNGQCNVSDWRDIIAIATGTFHTVGLRSNGTVVATKIIEDVLAKNYGQSNVGEWQDIVAMAVGTFHTVGLRSDSTVVAVGHYESGTCDVADWREIVAVAAGTSHTVGLRSNGTVTATGGNKNGQCNVSDWKLFDRFDTLPQEHEEAIRRADLERNATAEQRLVALTAEQASLKAEMANLKGLFSGKRRKEIEARLKELSDELNILNQ